MLGLAMLLVCSNAQASADSLVEASKRFLYNNPDSAISLCRQALESEEGDLITKFRSQAHRFIGIAYDIKGEYVQSIDAYDQALVIAELMDDSVQVANVLMAKGIIHHRVEDLVNALDLYLAALAIYERHDFEVGKNSVLNNIAAMYNDEGMYEKALSIYREILVKSAQAKDSSRLASALSNIAASLNGLGQYDSALIYVRQSIAISFKINDKYAIAGDYQTIAANLSALEKADSAYLYYKKSIDAFKENGDLYSLTEVLFGLAKSAYNLGNLELSKSMLDSAYSYAINGQNGAFKLQEIYTLYANVYADLDKKDISLQYFLKADSLNNTINQEEHEGQLLRFEILNQSNKYKSKYARSEAQRQIEVEKNKRQRMFSIMLFIGLIVALGFSGALLYTWGLKSKYLKELQAKNIDLENDLKSSERLVSILAHDFRSPISSVAMALTAIETHDPTKEEREGLISKAKKNLDVTLGHIDQLLFWISKDKKIIERKWVPIQQSIQQVIELHDIRINEKKVDIKLSGLQDTAVYFDELQLNVVIRNIISNSLKFVPEGGSIEVSMVETSKNQKLKFKDNGAGIKPEILAKIQKETFNQLIPKRLDSTGLGLQMIYEIVRLNKGDIEINSSPGKGTDVIITLPKQA